MCVCELFFGNCADLATSDGMPTNTCRLIQTMSMYFAGRILFWNVLCSKRHLPITSISASAVFCLSVCQSSHKKPKMSVCSRDSNMSGVLKLAKKFNCFYLSGFHSSECKPFVVEGFQVGLIRPDVMKQLINFPEVFHITPGCVELNPAFRDYEVRSAKIDEVLRKLRSQNVFVTLKGWRDECYEVKTEFGTDSLLKMDRSATCLFGIRNYGVTINGFIRHPQKGKCLWFQKRSATKQTWPGKWDSMVSGGLSVGHGIFETAHKEAMEEASVPTNLLQKLTSAGCVSFYFESERGLFPNTEFVFDLELPTDFNPENADGEVECFEILPVTQCLEKVLAGDFKTTSAPVVLDFLVRHGVITPESEPDYLKIIEFLHVPLQTIYGNHYRIKENGITLNNV